MVTTVEIAPSPILASPVRLYPYGKSDRMGLDINKLAYDANISIKTSERQFIHQHWPRPAEFTCVIGFKSGFRFTLATNKLNH